MIMATRCLAMQSAGRPLPPAFTSTNDLSISDNDGGDLLTSTGPTGNRKGRGDDDSRNAFEETSKISFIYYIDVYHIDFMKSYIFIVFAIFIMRIVEHGNRTIVNFLLLFSY